MAPLAAADASAPMRFADRAVRGVLPLGLEASRLGAAARVVRELPPLEGTEAGRRTMIALEKVARAHAAPDLLIRAAHGVAACAVSLGLEASRGAEAAGRAEAQLVSAIVRLVTTTVKTGVPPEAVVAVLSGDDASGG